MATGTANSAPNAPPVQAESARNGNDRFIEQQLDKTRLHVKLVDLFSGLMVWAAASLAFLQIVAVIDAWVVTLGTTGRVLALVVLVAGGLYFLVKRVLPLFVRSINPAYAARTIEESKPSLKNSLLNFLFLRSHREEVHRVVYHAVEQQAASDISSVPVESAVDRSKLIRIGYVLVGILLVAGLYKILSPKDPFTSLARVFSPFAQIARPSRVQISEVTPGSTQVFHGQAVQVAARISGLSSESPATLLYRTADGQTVDAKVLLKWDEASGLFKGTLASSDDGIQQDTWYRVVAGDAQTEEFHVKVRAAPTIVVQSVTYDYPRYTHTKLPPRLVERHGDVKALEGTQVTVHARANLPIKFAHIELSADVEKDALPRTEKVSMKVDGREATGEFLLQLNADRRSPQYSRYLIRFVTADDVHNENPIVHTIDVTPDLPPVVDVLEPKKDRIEVPVNRSANIEVRALDADFELSQITLRAVSGGSDVIRHNFISESAADPAAAREKESKDSDADRHGQVVVSYEFTPRKLGLSAGQEVVFWAVAADNRTLPGTDTLEPNTARTRNYVIKITPSDDPGAEDPFADPPPDDPTKSDAGAKPPDAGEKDPMRDPGEGDSSKPDGSGGQGGGDTEKKPNDASSNDGAGGDSSTTQKGDGTQQNSGEKGASGTGGDSTDGGSAKSDGQPTGDGQPRDANPADGQPGGENTGQNGNTGSPQPGARQSQSPSRGAGQDEPLHDGDVIEEVLKHREQKDSPSAGQPNGGAKPSGGQQDLANGQEPAGQKPPGGGDSDKKPAGQDSAGGQANNTDAQPNQQGSKPDGSGGTEQKPNGQQPNAQKPDGGGAQDNGSQPMGGSQDGGSKPQDGGTKDGGGAQKDSSQPGGGQQPGDMKDGGQPNGTGNQGPMKDAGGQQDQGGGSSGGDMKPMQGSQDGGNQPQGSGGSQQQPMGGDQPSGGTKPNQGSGNSGGDQGKQGGGQESDAQGGSPQAQQEKKQNGSQNNSSGGSQQKQDGGAQSPSIGGKQSDTPGQQGGDRSGQGDKGGGSQSNQQGNDTPGSNSPADEGAGAANERGSGETSDRPGGDQKADQPTGAPGSESGPGSKSQNDPTGSQRTVTPGNTGGNQGTFPTGGQGNNQNSKLDDPTTFDGPLPPGEKENLEYAKKATDLALDYLKDQEDNPDRELLDKLNWTEDDLRKFLERWDSLKRKADVGDTEDRTRYVERIRSLGLRENPDERRGGGARDDTSRGLRDSGAKSSPPAKYLEQFNAFIKGTARAEDDE